MDMGRNSEHYSDPTPGTAWENMRREEKRLDAARLVMVSPLPVGLAVVKYDKKQSAFRAFPVDRPWCACQIAYPDEIVGNIYDNPDLLKQGEDTQK